MSARTTGWLLSVALGLFAWIYFFERHSLDSAARAEQATRLFPSLDPAAVKAIEVTRTNQVIRAERVGSRWRLTTPAYPAQSTAIETLLQSLSELRRYGFVSAEEILSQSGG